MSFIFNIITGIFDGILYPFRSLPPLIGLAFIALLTALFALLVYKHVSNQTAITRGKKRIFGHFFGIYLYRHDLGRILKELGRVFISIGRYLRYVLPPLLVIIIPIMLILVQLQLRYGYRGPVPGEELNLTMRVKPEADILDRRAELVASAGVSVRTPALRIRSRGEADWRIKVEKTGDHPLTFQFGEETLTKILRARPESVRIYPKTAPASFSFLLGAPGSRTIPESSSIIEATVDYPEREINVFGIHLHWALAFLILVLLIGFSLRKPLKVDF